MELNEAIHLIRSKEKMIKASFRKGSGNTKEYLEGLIEEALHNTQLELNKQVESGVFQRAIAKGIHKALSTMPEIKEHKDGEVVATFPEFKANELYIHSVSIELKA